MLRFRQMIRLLGHKPSSGSPQPTEPGDWEELKKEAPAECSNVQGCSGFLCGNIALLGKETGGLIGLKDLCPRLPHHAVR